MQRSTPPTSHRRVSGSSGRAKVVATGIAVATLLLSIAAAVDSNRLISEWRADTGANLNTPVGTGGHHKHHRAKAEIVIPTIHAARPVPVHPGPIQRATPARPTGVPTGSPTASSGWAGSVGPACDHPRPPSTGGPQPSTTSSPTPGPTPSPPSTVTPTATAVSTPDDAPPCPSSADRSTPTPTSAASNVPVLNP
jgi:hypothetical protein